MERKWPVLCLLFVFASLAVMSMRHNSATSDEVTHITSGYSYWKYFDYTFNPEHPPLVKLWATIPLLIMNPPLPGAPTSWEGEGQWDYAQTFLYKIGNDADVIYFWSRLMIVVMGIVLGYYVYRWASELYGWKAGLLALVFYVFDSNILAHSTVVHTDIPISAALFILLYYFWKWSRDVLNWKQLGVLSALLGIVLATKFTGLYVIPILFILYFVHLYFDYSLKEQVQKEGDVFARFGGFYTALQEEAMKKELLGKTKVFGVVLGIGIFIVLLTYGFVHISSYFVGLASVAKQSALSGSPAYLLGMNSIDGWWYYFIVAFLVKTPVPTLILVGSALYLFFKTKLHEKKAVRDALFLLIPATLYFLAFLPSKYNIGMRHILPIYPFLFVFMSSVLTINMETLGGWLAKYKTYTKYILSKYVLLFLIAWLIMSTVFAYPYYLPYFNDLVGGSKNGYKYLLDSNLDWGQGLKETALWLEEHGYSNTTIRMSYFGNEDPAYRGIVYQKIMCAPTPGIHVISVNKLYDFQGNQYRCVDWLLRYEPLAIIGYSMYIYTIDDPTIIENYTLCKTDCAKGCVQRGQAYGDSLYKDKDDRCICICAEATNEELGIV